MNKLLLLVFTSLCTIQVGMAQDCYQRPTLLVGSAQLGFKKPYMTPQVKIGIWRNLRSNGYTAFIGYQDSQPVKVSGSKPDTLQLSSSFLVEAGYKIRLAKYFFAHGIAGMDNIGAYLAGDLLYQAHWNLLLGLTYKRSYAGISLYIRCN